MEDADSQEEYEELVSQPDDAKTYMYLILTTRIPLVLPGDVLLHLDDLDFWNQAESLPRIHHVKMLVRSRLDLRMT